MSLELMLWREACRRIDLQDFLIRALPLLVEQLPIQSLLIRRLELATARLETLAWEGAELKDLSVPARSSLTVAQRDSLVRWCDVGQCGRGPGGEVPLLSLMLPEGLRGQWLVGPLLHETGPLGVVLLQARPGAVLQRLHEQLLQAVLEPFTLALYLDRQFHELARLREAAEADSRAALSRLGRGDIVERVVGEEGGLREVMLKVNQVAPTEAPVLILGETGSGKEVVARAIHARSRRQDGPVLRVNCGAIPPEIIDSELFGHEKGSFTGAMSLRRGWFERADGGTLFLDEIGELPLAAQVRLLRVLQDGTFERVGGQRPVTVDVRIVAATHMDLPGMVQRGTFRMDLWYRLSVFVIHLPALREHKEDIPALARHFAARAGRRLAGQPIEPTQADIEQLMQHQWPGNVRELSAVIERAAIFGNLRKLDVVRALEGELKLPSISQPLLDPSYGRGQQLPHLETDAHTRLELMTARRMHHLPERGLEVEPEGGVEQLDAAMREHIIRALKRTQGQIEGREGAAKVLGINPHTLRARMRKLHIDWSQFRPPREP